MNIDDLLRIAMERRSSDLHLKVGNYPHLRIDGDLVLLCWRRGESRIEYWHTLEAGFRGRQPLDERFGRGWRDRPN